nr:unnamed protein product [Callosobruchus chinensis]
MPKDRRSRKHSRRLGSLRRILERLEKRRESDSEESSESSLTDGKNVCCLDCILAMHRYIYELYIYIYSLCLGTPYFDSDASAIIIRLALRVRFRVRFPRTQEAHLEEPLSFSSVLGPSITGNQQVSSMLGDNPNQANRFGPNIHEELEAVGLFISEKDYYQLREEKTFCPNIYHQKNVGHKICLN